MKYLVVFQLTGDDAKTILGNYEHTFNGKPTLDDIRNLENQILEEYVRPKYKDIRNLMVVIVNLVPLGW